MKLETSEDFMLSLALNYSNQRDFPDRKSSHIHFSLYLLFVLFGFFVIRKGSNILIVFSDNCERSLLILQKLDEWQLHEGYLQCGMYSHISGHLYFVNLKSIGPSCLLNGCTTL